MNACEAARTINKSADDRSNFVDSFLAHCASGFIGPLAQVDIQTASIIGKRLLLAARNPVACRLLNYCVYYAKMR